MIDPFKEEFFRKNKFYRTAQGDIGRLHYQTQERISLELANGEIEIHPEREIALVRLNRVQREKWYEEYVLTVLTKKI